MTTPHHVTLERRIDLTGANGNTAKADRLIGAIIEAAEECSRIGVAIMPAETHLVTDGSTSISNVLILTLAGYQVSGS